MTKIHIPTVRIIAFKSKILADGSFPINLVVTSKGRRKYFSLNMKAKYPGNWKITKDEEGETLQRYKKNKKNYKSLNKQLDDHQRKADDIIERLCTKRSFTFDRFDRIFSSNDDDMQVFQFLNTRYQELIKEERIGTAYSVKDMSSFLKKYVSEKRLEWTDIDSDWIGRFKTWARNYTSLLTQKKVATNTVAIYLRTLKAAYNEVYKRQGIKPEYHAFDGVKIETTRTLKRALSKDLIVKISKMRNPELSQKWFAQKYFLFCYLNNGMNFYDLAELTWNCINDGRINYTRRKTKRRTTEGESFSIKIELPTQKILDRFIQISKSQYVFPIIDPSSSEEEKYKQVKNKRHLYNKYLKDIAEDIGIPRDKMTSYVVRHTYATVLKRNGQSTELIQESLGHQSKKTTETYLASFDHSVLDDANKQLL